MRANYDFSQAKARKNPYAAQLKAQGFGDLVDLEVTVEKLNHALDALQKEFEEDKEDG